MPDVSCVRAVGPSCIVRVVDTIVAEGYCCGGYNEVSNDGVEDRTTFAGVSFAQHASYLIGASCTWGIERDCIARRFGETGVGIEIAVTAENFPADHDRACGGRGNGWGGCHRFIWGLSGGRESQDGDSDVGVVGVCINEAEGEQAKGKIICNAMFHSFSQIERKDTTFFANVQIKRGFFRLTSGRCYMDVGTWSRDGPDNHLLITY